MPVPRPIRYYLLRFLRLRGSPRSIALGAGIEALQAHAVAVTAAREIDRRTILVACQSCLTA